DRLPDVLRGLASVRQGQTASGAERTSQSRPGGCESDPSRSPLSHGSYPYGRSLETPHRPPRGLSTSWPAAHGIDGRAAQSAALHLTCSGVPIELSDVKQLP